MQRNQPLETRGNRRFGFERRAFVGSRAWWGAVHDDDDVSFDRDFREIVLDAVPGEHERPFGCGLWWWLAATQVEDRHEVDHWQERRRARGRRYRESGGATERRMHQRHALIISAIAAGGEAERGQPRDEKGGGAALVVRTGLASTKRIRREHREIAFELVGGRNR